MGTPLVESNESVRWITESDVRRRVGEVLRSLAVRASLPVGTDFHSFLFHSKDVCHFTAAGFVCVVTQILKWFVVFDSSLVVVILVNPMQQ